MRNLISFILVVLLSFSFFATEGFAKRFGGGRSIGVQRSISRAAPLRAPTSFKNPLSSNRWFGPLAGLITGGLIASLLMGHGLGTGILMWLVIGLIGFSIFNALRRRTSAHTLQPSYANQDPQLRGSLAHFGSQIQSDESFGSDSDSFLQEAKVKFIRLQAAYDQKNLNDIRSFTTPEMFAEIQLQLLDRGDDVNITEVVTLHAQLIAPQHNFATSEITSVQFSGLIRENQHENAASFNEIWNFCKDPHQKTWLVAGIQQTGNDLH